jgi:hypothetical protein
MGLPIVLTLKALTYSQVRAILDAIISFLGLLLHDVGKT